MPVRLRRLASWGRALGASLALTLGGCALDASTAPVCRPPACQPMQGSFAVEVRPPDDALDRAVLLDQPALSFSDGGEVVLTLAHPVHISGHVLRADGATVVPGTVVISRASRIAGRPTLSWQAVVDSSGFFTLAVPPTLQSEKYTVRFVATDPAATPPITVTTVAMADVPLELRTAAPGQLGAIKGRVVDALGMPIAGMRVSAVDATSGDLLSTTVVTDGSGVYALDLSEDARSVQLQAAPTDKAPAGLPTLSRTLSVAAGQSTSADLAVPALPAVQRFSWRVTGMGSSGVEQPIPGAHCLFSASVSDPAAPDLTAQFRLTVDTDADGYATADLVPGDRTTPRTYQILVAPPSSSPFSTFSRTLDVGALGGIGADIVLAPRPQLIGRVVDKTGLPLDDVRVQPGAGGTTSDSLAAVLQPASADTATDGRFLLRVDPGTYDVGLVPGAQRMLPRRWLDPQRVMSDLDLGDVLLPDPVLLRARIVDADGQAIGNAAMQIFLLPAAAVTNTDAASPPRVLVDAISATDGTASLILPAQTSGPANAR